MTKSLTISISREINIYRPRPKMLPNYMLGFTSLLGKTGLGKITTVTWNLTAWTGAAFSASVRMEWESGPIRRNLFISIVKSLEERKSVKMGASVIHDVCDTSRNRRRLQGKGAEQLQPHLITMPVAAEIQE